MNGDNMRETGFMRKWHFPRKRGGQAKTCLLMLFLVLCHTLRASYAQAVLTMRLENLTVTEALKEVSATTGFEFFYNANQLAKCGKRVNADFKEAKLQDVLAGILLETDFTFRIEEHTIIILPRPESRSQVGEVKMVTLKGVVLDEEKMPMTGVTVYLETETLLGTTTNEKGEYALSVPVGEYNVVFSFVGYEKLVKRFTGKNADDFFRVFMTPALVQMEDVVVTGIYQRKKESFTGSSTTFKSEELKAVGTQNVLQSLKTLDPSFKIMESNQFGSDPNRLPDIEIRGKSSVMGLKEEYGTDPNQPLFILDGFETTLQTIMDLNMNRVASVTLLKDAASTAIYGSKAANGVVVIETKAPERGKLQLSYKGDFSVTVADLTDYNLMNSREKLEFETLAGVYKDRNSDICVMLA